MKIAVVGLGYVGLPLAVLAAKRGHEVVGIDVNKRKVEKINAGEIPFDDSFVQRNFAHGMLKATTDFSVLKDTKTIVVCVPTPVKENHLPDLSYVKSAAQSVAQNLENDHLVVLESTVYPGTTEEIVQPILDAAQKQYFLAHCPERIDPGNDMWTVENIPRVVGGVDEASTHKATVFYKTLIDADVVAVKSSKEAEATKIMENTFRDVNIAFVNEMAMSFQRAGIDIMEVIRGASTKPFGFMAHYPGCGVGGHCISVDPYYLIENAKSYGFNHEFLKLARKINNGMPAYTVGLLEQEVDMLGENMKGAKVGVLGLAYKGGVDDTRESPAYPIIALLKQKGAEVTVYDPFVKDESDVDKLEELFEHVDYVVLVTDHKQFKEMDLELLKKHGIKVVIDGRNCLDGQEIRGEGVVYVGVGSGLTI